MSRHLIAVLVAASVFGSGRTASAQSSDPPGRIGRVSELAGSVSLLPVGDSDWGSASLNYPLTTGDALWADADARAEVHVGASSVHLAPGTMLVFDAIQDDLIQLRISQGAVRIRLRELDRGESYEIDSPEGAILLHVSGTYRVDVTPDGRRTTITVRDGDADVQVGGYSYPLRQGTSVTLTGDGGPPTLNDGAVASDDWESWADTRDRREDARTATRYVSRDMVGYEDLDDYGDWDDDPSYGPVWYPRAVPPDWAPYRTGRWEWVQPWGWTWVDEAPWGFAPFHYGRWAHRGGRWGWYPGREVVRPVYAPALVAFVSGDNWSASLSFGSGGGVGWVPLGPEEVYVPAYRASPTYVRNVNVTNVSVTNINVTNIDVNSVRYVNRTVPGAVTAVPRDAFVRSRPVERAAVPVRPADLDAARVSPQPVAAGAPIATPPPRAPGERRRSEDAGPIRQPPAEVARDVTARRQPRAAQPAPVPAAPPGPPERGRANVGQPPQALPAPESPAPTPPTPKVPPGRARNQPAQPAPAPATPPPARPPLPPGRARNQPAQPTPTPAAPPAATPQPPPGRGRNQPAPASPRPVSPPPTAPAPPKPNAEPGRGRTPPTPPTARPAPPGRARRPTPADTGRARKPPKGRPDSTPGAGDRPGPSA